MHTLSDVHLRSRTKPEGSQRGEGSITWLPSFAHEPSLLTYRSASSLCLLLNFFWCPPPPLSCSLFVFPGPSSPLLGSSSTVSRTLPKEAALFCLFVFGSIIVPLTKSALVNPPGGQRKCVLVGLLWEAGANPCLTAVLRVSRRLGKQRSTTASA